jgi:hypothetical protein
MTEPISLNTTFKELSFLSTHNSSLIDAQLCGTVSMRLIEETLDYLEFAPVCIELDVCKYSKNRIKKVANTFIDHYSKNFITFDTSSTPRFTPTTVSRGDKAYDSFNKKYFEGLSRQFSVKRIFERINQVLDSTPHRRFPLIISMDISALKSRPEEERTAIFNEIERKFYGAFRGKTFESTGDDKQTQLLETELSDLMNVVLLRIDSKHGDISKPPGASEKIVVSKRRDGDFGFFEQPENADETEFLTRIYPDLKGLGKRRSLTTVKEAAKIKLRRGSSLVTNRSTLDSVLDESSAEQSTKSKVNSSIKSILKSKLPLKRTTADSVLRADCQGDPVNYKSISNLIVKQFILNSETRLENVNCVAVNLHDLLPKIKTKFIDYFKVKYNKITGNPESMNFSNESITVPASLPVNQSENDYVFSKTIQVEGKKKPKSQRKRKPKSQRKRKPKSQSQKKPKSQSQKKPKSQSQKKPKSQRKPKSQKKKKGTNTQK